MLLTGDARGDYIVDGLERAGFLRNGPAKLDVVKLQHHGSARNTDEKFFSTVLADHYVISANGKYGNPDPETLEMIATARGKDEFTIHLTNHDGEGGLRELLDKFVARAEAAGAKFKVAYREEPDPIRIELGDPLGF